MKIKKIGQPEIIMSAPNEKHNYFAWPSAIRLKDDRIAIGASGFRIAHICPFGKSVIAFSDDDGKTYSKPIPVIDTVLDDRDVGLCTFGESGLIFTSFNNTVEFQKRRGIRTPETDAYLETITQEQEDRDVGSTFRISFDNGNTWSPIYKSPITSPHGPIQLKNGKILWVGRVYTVQNTFDEDSMPYLRVCEVTLDGKVTEIGHIDDVDMGEEQPPTNFCEPYMFECEDGKLICHIRAETPWFTTFQSESYDGGKTWTKAHPILNLDKGGAPAHIMRHSSGVLVSAYGYRKGPYGIKVMLSADEGNTWETDFVLIDDSPRADLGYPATVELHDGTLITVYYAHETADGPAMIYQQKWSIEK